MDSRERYLIKNTTREEREAIVRKSLGSGDCADARDATAFHARTGLKCICRISMAKWKFSR